MRVSPVTNKPWNEQIMDYKKLLSAFVGVLLELSGMVPGNVQQLSETALMLIILDMVLGSIASARNGQFSSSQMRKGLALKLTSYFGIVIFCGIISFQSGSWNWVLAGWGGVCACEVTSVTENLLVLIKQAEQSGAKLGPLTATLSIITKRVEPLFALSADVPNTALTQPTTPPTPTNPTTEEEKQ